MEMISIVIPVYNLQSYIQRCLESIIQQSYQNYEIILVDDGSSDTSNQICLDFKRNNPSKSITVISKQNEGVTAARRDGVKASNGNWILFVDGDDTLPCKALESLVMHASEGIGVVLGAHNIEYSDGTSIFCSNKSIGQFNKHEYIKIVLNGKYEGAPWAKLFKKKIINDYVFDIPREIKNKEDFIMNLRISLMQEEDVVFVNESVYNYLYNRGGSALTSFRTAFNLDYEIKIIDILVQDLIIRNLRDQYKKEIGNLYSYNIWEWSKNFDKVNKSQKNKIRSICTFVLKHNFSFRNLIKVLLIYMRLFMK